MKKKINILIAIVAALALMACSPAAPVEAGQSAADEAPKASTEAKAKAIPSVDIELLGKPWEKVDAENTGYIFAYSEPQSTSSVLMSYAKHYEEREATLQDDLKANVENYIMRTLPVSMKEMEAGEVEYFDIGGYPAARFSITGSVEAQSYSFTADTIFIANEEGIYCLQMQSPSESYGEFEQLFESIAQSITMDQK